MGRDELVVVLSLCHRFLPRPVACGTSTCVDIGQFQQSDKRVSGHHGSVGRVRIDGWILPSRPRQAGRNNAPHQERGTWKPITSMDHFSSLLGQSDTTRKHDGAPTSTRCRGLQTGKRDRTLEQTHHKGVVSSMKSRSNNNNECHVLHNANAMRRHSCRHTR